jgi:hypothetical protein
LNFHPNQFFANPYEPGARSARLIGMTGPLGPISKSGRDDQ